MDITSSQIVTAAVAPVVMVSASGLLFIGVQTKNLHLSDRVRMLMAEYRGLGTTAGDRERRGAIAAQLAYFERRIRLSQWALECLYLAIGAFVLTSLAVAAAPWVSDRAASAAVLALFLAGVGLLLTALVFEFLEMRVGLATIRLEIRGATADGTV